MVKKIAGIAQGACALKYGVRHCFSGNVLYFNRKSETALQKLNCKAVFLMIFCEIRAPPFDLNFQKISDRRKENEGQSPKKKKG